MKGVDDDNVPCNNEMRCGKSGAGLTAGLECTGLEWNGLKWTLDLNGLHYTGLALQQNALLTPPGAL
jgi:hypothetical protein